jgi:hypothetical protein
MLGAIPLNISAKCLVRECQGCGDFEGWRYYLEAWTSCMLGEVECESLSDFRWMGRRSRCLVAVHNASFGCGRHVGFDSIYKTNKSAGIL